MHLLAKAYGSKPSSWFSELDETEALTLDLMALREGTEAERREVRAQQVRQGVRRLR